MYCSACGAYVSEGSRFCPSCGKETGSSAENNTGSVAEPEAGAGTDILALLCYFGILLLIPYIIRPGSQFVKYHANQGLLLLLLGIACGVVSIIPILGWIVGVVAGIFTAVCWVIGIINVLRGRMNPLPIIGKYNILH
ncbi:MAG: zinc-ribbon domain-containing protein [Oscillospiraceae bacterium]|nr:zinc-ribbon domain-containing protein [Oscillospiraceae bacterium]